MFAVMTKHNKSISLGLIRKQREAAGRQEAPRDEEEEEKTKKTRRRRRRRQEEEEDGERPLMFHTTVWE